MTSGRCRSEICMVGVRPHSHESVLGINSYSESTRKHTLSHKNLSRDLVVCTGT